MAHGFQHGPLGALCTGLGSPDFPTALNILRMEEDVLAPMPSFPLGSPAFPSPSLISNDDHVVVSVSQLAAIRVADPSPSPTPSHFSASPTTFAAIQQALPNTPMIIDGTSPTCSSGSRTPTRSHSVLPMLQIPWSPTPVQSVTAPLPPCKPLCKDPATASGPPAGNAAGSPIVSQTIKLGTRIEGVDQGTLQPARAPGD